MHARSGNKYLAMPAAANPVMIGLAEQLTLYDEA